MLSSNAMLWYSLETARWGWCSLVVLLVLLCFFLSRTVSCSFLSLITNSWLNTLKNMEGFAFALLAWLCCKRSLWREGGETSSTIETILIFHCENKRLKSKPMWIQQLHAANLMAGDGVRLKTGPWPRCCWQLCSLTLDSHFIPFLCVPIWGR